ncbi:MAG TPA: PilZ domain-containing protein [Candidatus Acidoferrales bacterium]|nr:PilZ domain-containing protein [Candidatus Acidoferrales bacterium]
MERRQSTRAKPYGLVYLNLAKQNGGILIDASEGGLQFQSVAPIENGGGPMSVWFTLRQSLRIEAVGEVVWTDSSKRSGGIRFTKLGASERSSLRDWLGENAKPSLDVAQTMHSVMGDEAPASASILAESASDPVNDEMIVEFPTEASLRNPRDAARRSSAPIGEAAAPKAKPNFARASLGPYILPTLPDEPVPLIPAEPEASPEADLTALPPEPEATPPAASQRPSDPPRPSRPSIVASSAPSKVERPSSIPEPPPVPPSLSDKLPYATRHEPGVASLGESQQSLRNPSRPAEDFSRFRGEAAGSAAEQSLSSSSAAAPSFPDSGSGPLYSGYETDAVLNEALSGARHRASENPAPNRLNAPATRAVSLNSPSLQSAPSGATYSGASARGYDYAAPWRAEIRTNAPAPRENASHLAAFLYKAGVPRNMLREFEIMIAGILIVAALGLGMLAFRQNVGEGVRWIGQQIATLNPQSGSHARIAENSPADTNISPLLQPPPEAREKRPPAKTRPAPANQVVSEAGVGGAANSRPIAAGSPETEAVPPDDTGESELATGLQYLRDADAPAETSFAVKWLWASVEKGNTKAAIILADLYAWGRGVPQNCDQARVLLMSAVRRGSTEAGQRLQDMDAEGGCPAGSKPSTK